ncbi:MAG: peptidoglycan DD-metalloendopeptidase family protein, partial [Gammaproteobacteria bacterium]|nr:peptidoglycan DD-metalloendopeptidase family protein [Gammaproteobacteria bacterium]
LETLMEGLRDALADVPANAGQRKAFKSQRGRLRLPVRGKITANYGSRRKAGGFRWQGVMIRAKQGADVKAVSHGRVAFADWLRGFGLMVIVDHGDGYMSLYGHNESLYVETGDWVEAGDVVSAVGSSGGQKRAGLYFEIRANGKPTNPLRWCKR